MKQGTGIAFGVIVAALAAGGGYWVGHREAALQSQASAVTAPPAKKILYYRNPMGLSDTSLTP